jgi:hypothetical protein
MAGNSFLEEVLEHVFSFIQDGKDRNVISMVCKLWYEREWWSRRRVFLGNCYAISLHMVIRQFPNRGPLDRRDAAYPWLKEIKFGSSAWWSQTS